MGKRYGPVIQPLLGRGSKKPDSLKRLKIEPIRLYALVVPLKTIPGE